MGGEGAENFAREIKKKLEKKSLPMLMDPWEILLRYAFMGIIIYLFILGKGTSISGPDQMKLTLAILLLFALFDIYSGVWSNIKRWFCGRSGYETSSAASNY